MNREVILDIETQNTFQDVGEYNPALLKISLIGVYFYETDTYETFLENELGKLWTRLEKADRIIGYNTLSFDYQVMNQYYAGKFEKISSLDILVEIEKALGFRVKLDDVAQATLGVGKSGHGLMAIEYFKRGELDKLRDYCLQDVRVTKGVYEYGRANGRIYCFDRSGHKMEIAVNFSPPVDQKRSSINLTMPF